MAHQWPPVPLSPWQAPKEGRQRACRRSKGISGISDSFSCPPASFLGPRAVKVMTLPVTMFPRRWMYAAEDNCFEANHRAFVRQLSQTRLAGDIAEVTSSTKCQRADLVWVGVDRIASEALSITKKPSWHLMCSEHPCHAYMTPDVLLSQTTGYIDRHHFRVDGNQTVGKFPLWTEWLWVNRDR